MLSADNARKALQFNFQPKNIKVGTPQPFTKGYDNYTGGEADIANFNLMNHVNKSFGIKGNFGEIAPGQVQNLISGFPTYLATWNGVSFINGGVPPTLTWIGTAVSPNDVSITIDPASGHFTGTLGAYGTISGQAQLVNGIWKVVNGSVSIDVIKQIFYGKISWGMTNNDGLGSTDNQIFVRSFTDLIHVDYFVTLNSAKTLASVLTVDSLQGEITGTASQVAFAGKNNIYFDGYIFPLETS
jgi:hypothetical protein